MKKKHLLFLVGDFPYYIENGYKKNIPSGGIATFVDELTQELIKKNYKCTIIGEVKVKEIKYFQNNGIKVYLIPSNKYQESCITIGKIINKINEIDPIDLIETTDSKPLLKNYIKDIPVLMRLHSTMSLIQYNAGKIKNFKEINSQNEILKHFSLYFADSIVGVSNSIIKSTIEFHKINKEKIYGSIYNTAYIENISIKKFDKKQMFYHGTLAHGKGTKELVNFFERFSKNNDFTLNIIGRGKEFLDINCPQIYKNKKFKYTQHMDKKKLIKSISKYGIYINFSKSEAGSVAVMEAMKLGKPAILSNNDYFKEIKEIIGEGLFIVDPLNYDEISHAINQIYSNYDFYSKEIKEKVNLYSMEKFINKNIEWYDFCLQNKKKLIESRSFEYNELHNLMFYNEKNNKKISKDENSLLFLDNIHLKNASFPILHKYLNKNNYNLYVITEFKELKYKGIKDSNYLNEYIFLLKYYLNISYDLEYRNINIYEMCKDEILYELLCKKKFHQDMYKSNKDEKSFFRYIYLEFEDLLLNMFSTTMFWIDYYNENINSINFQDKVFIFSGANIYQKVFVKINETKIKNQKIYMLENFFTGRDWFIEEQKEPIPNNIRISYQENIEKVYIEFAQKKINNIKNLNIDKQIENYDLKFENDNTFIIIGQVVNDYSIISSENKYISTINFYKELIENLVIKNKYNIIIKLHPYEKLKLNQKESLTKKMLLEYLENNKILPRVQIIEEYNINSLIKKYDKFITLCSQTAFEILNKRKKPIIFGSAYYQNNGFTYEFDNIKNFMLNIDKLDYSLKEEEYKKYLNYIGLIFRDYLVSEFENKKLKIILGYKKIKTDKKEIYETNNMKKHLVNYIYNNNLNIDELQSKIIKYEKWIKEKDYWLKEKDKKIETYENRKIIKIIKIIKKIFR